jgi:hypothetical protein
MKVLFQGAAIHDRREHNQRIAQAWWTAALSKGRKLPALRELLIDERGPRRKRSWQELKALLMVALPGPGKAN